MDTEIIKTIYGLTALAGVIVYALLAWKSAKPAEEFNPAKFFDSLLTSGTLGIILSAAGLATLGFNFVTLVTAFFTGVGIDVGLNKFLKAADNSKPADPQPIPPEPAPVTPATPT